MRISVEEIIDFLHRKNFDVSYIGSKNIEISSFCSINNPKSNSISWVKNPSETALEKFTGYNDCIIVAKKEMNSFMDDCGFIITENPKSVFFSVLSEFWSTKKICGTGKSSIVLSKKIGYNTNIGEHCFIGEDVEIGDNCIIEHNVTILNRVVIGAGCIIHSGTVLGTDGFGYYKDEMGVPQKVEHFGGIKIGDGVEIGANSCIDRGTIDDTIIGNFSKIDNLVHISHNVVIGENVMICCGSIICGSVNIGSDTYIAPDVSVKNQLTVGESSLLGMGAVVNKSVGVDKVVIGSDAKEMKGSAKAFMSFLGIC